MFASPSNKQGREGLLVQLMDLIRRGCSVGAVLLGQASRGFGAGAAGADAAEVLHDGWA